MARSPKSPEAYDKLRQESGWYLAAWRAHRNLTLETLAVAMETSRGQISDLENGATNKKGVQTRYNRDWLEKACAALEVAAGDLIDTNPFREEPRFAAIKRAFPELSSQDVEQLVFFADGMAKRAAANG
jgi:transcriptional regulator with XRE-family HTH domain